MDGPVASQRIGPSRPGIAERIWEAARTEFSKRGYHGARVQGIARGASCNVALMYRHWASKRALYLDILRAVWLGTAKEIALALDGGGGGPRAVVGEYLDGAPFLSQLVEADPALLDPVRQAAATLAGRDGAGFHPGLALVTVGGL